ncbi:hypothetical protein NYR55_03480 [Sphingomonas sp. BGYR3]|uniref:hypothetical protein n=1 Tax=Sphingomonas sp. BGYR3 TaxID=2975483 RepID=UPI0021A34CE2|nr:hypothetical protein [Sphingomonas sp. BGYR3]MDG5487686.1 hypothetical protein [Sphingomonas sp. BGYR3]
MAIRITPLEDARLQLSGDLDDMISLYPSAVDDGFVIATSDGTLLQGDVDSITRACRFSVLVEGAGIVTIGRTDHGDVLHLAWRVEWISVARTSDACCRQSADTLHDQREFLFENGVRMAA